MPEQRATRALRIGSRARPGQLRHYSDGMLIVGLRQQPTSHGILSSSPRRCVDRGVCSERACRGFAFLAALTAAPLCHSVSPSAFSLLRSPRLPPCWGLVPVHILSTLAERPPTSGWATCPGLLGARLLLRAVPLPYRTSGTGLEVAPCVLAPLGGVARRGGVA